MNRIVQIYFIWIVVFMACACEKSEYDHPDSHMSNGTYSLILYVEDETFEQVVTRAVEENSIRNLNIWAYGIETGRNFHLYTTQGLSSTTLELVPGNYHIYVIANSGKDLGEMSEASLQALSFTFDGEPKDKDLLAMAARGEINISGPASLTLRLKRLVSKVSLSLDVLPSLQGSLSLENIQLLSVPKKCLYFGDNRPTDLAEVIDYPKESLTSGSYNRTYYLPENLAGTNSAVTSEQQKDISHAPSGASRLCIHARHGDRLVTYHVYLGENNTDDFNVTRNTVQHLNITLCGSNPNDLRVARFSLSLGSIASSYLPLDVISTPFVFTAENQKSNQFTLACKMTQGSGRVLLDGTDITSTSISLPSTGSSRTLSFEPNTYGQQVAFTLTVSDAEGRQVSRTLSTYIKPRGELLLSMPSLGRPMAGSRSTFPITISEENYNRSFRLQLTTATSQSIASFYFQGQKLTPGVPSTFTVNAATHQVEIVAANTIGDVDLTATVTDDWKDSKTVTRTATVLPEIIVLHPSLSVNIQREYPMDSLYVDEPYVTLQVKAEKSVPVAVTVSVNAQCTGYCSFNKQHKTIPVKLTVTIPAGKTTSNSVQTSWPMEVSSYYINGNVEASVGYNYESVVCQPLSVTPSFSEGVAFQLNAE